MNIRSWSKRSLLATTASVLSMVVVSWAALFCFDQLMPLLDYKPLFQGVGHTLMLTITVSLIAVIVRYFPTSVAQEKFQLQLHETAINTHKNTVESLDHVLKDLLVHMNRIRLELGGEDFEVNHVMYLIGKAIEEAELKQGLLRDITLPENTTSFQNIRL